MPGLTCSVAGAASAVDAWTETETSTGSSHDTTTAAGRPRWGWCREDEGGFSASGTSDSPHPRVGGGVSWCETGRDRPSAGASGWGDGSPYWGWGTEKSHLLIRGSEGRLTPVDSSTCRQVSVLPWSAWTTAGPGSDSVGVRSVGPHPCLFTGTSTDVGPGTLDTCTTNVPSSPTNPGSTPTRS